MVSLFHRPKSWMMLASTKRQRRAMAPAALSDWAEISVGRIPESGTRTQAARRRAVMSAEVTYDHGSAGVER